MNKLFIYLSIKNKIFILISIPIVLIIFISSNIMYKGYQRTEQLDYLKNAVILSTKISSLVHETQAERGISSMFIENNSEEIQKRLRNQYFKTNKKLRDLNKFIKQIKITNLNKKNVEVLLQSLNYTSNIVNIREKVQNLFISSEELLTLYTDVNEKYLQSIVNVSKISISSTVTRQLIAYLNFLLAKEKVDIQRAIGASILTKDEFEEGVRVKFNNILAEENIFINNFLKYYENNTKNFYKKTIDNKSIEELTPIINNLLCSSKKVQIISGMQNIIGYGGLIHNFKNFIIHKDDKYAKRVDILYQDLLKSIYEYRIMQYINEEELSLLEDIENVFISYKQNLPKVIKAINNKVSIPKSDKIIQIDDTPAIEALFTLNNSLFSVKASV